MTLQKMAILFLVHLIICETSTYWRWHAEILMAEWFKAPIICSLGLVNKLLLRDDDDLDHFMNTVVKEALEIPAEVTWGGQSGDVFDYLSEDFMKPATEVGMYISEQF